MNDQRALLAIAERAARMAAPLLLDAFGSSPAALRTKSSPTDPVSEADEASERAIRSLLARLRPDDGVLGEEGREARGSSGLRWVVDPLDGTVNFVFGIPAWCVSVACEDDHGPLAGVVLDPNRGELFGATRDGDATVDGRPIHGSHSEQLALSLVATGFSYDSELRALQAEVAGRVLPRARDLRRFGAAALDLAWAACGRVDAYYERGLKPWDWAAGGLICERAGLVVRELEPAGGLPNGLLAAPPAIVDELAALVAG
ncbi:MAG TPA: inositol monophosphatase family protein [Solirubrobacteraceae bacterium]|nr:inositol monophosphatase family protein [Solirubrobacteraceae bacterium]